jgi:hypothetical protein
MKSVEIIEIIQELHHHNSGPLNLSAIQSLNKSASFCFERKNKNHWKAGEINYLVVAFFSGIFISLIHCIGQNIDLRFLTALPYLKMTFSKLQRGKHPEHD